MMARGTVQVFKAPISTVKTVTVVHDGGMLKYLGMAFVRPKILGLTLIKSSRLAS